MAWVVGQQQLSRKSAAPGLLLSFGGHLALLSRLNNLACWHLSLGWLIYISLQVVLVAVAVIISVAQMWPSYLSLSSRCLSCAPPCTLSAVSAPVSNNSNSVRLYMWTSIFLTLLHFLGPIFLCGSRVCENNKILITRLLPDVICEMPDSK